MKEKIQVTRRLVAQGQLLAKPGQRVRHDDVIGKLDYIPGQMVRCNVAAALGIDSLHIQKKMAKNLNDWINQGDILAENREFYTHTYLVSPTSGYIALISRFLGNVFIREPLPAGPKEPIWYRAEELGMSKLAFAAGLTVKQGSVVDRGRVLISNRKPPIVAPAVGKIREISTTEGYLILAPLYQPTELLAHLDGVIKETSENGALVVESYGYRYQGVMGFGGEQVGQLLPLLAEDRDLDVDDLPEQIRGSIVLARGGVTLAALRRLEQLEISGLIVGSLDQEVLGKFSHEEPLMVMGQRMELPFTVIMMQGFGSAMPQQTYRQIAEHAGLLAAIDGSTQLRAGVIRPEILIPLAEEIPLDTKETIPTALNLQVNDAVILIREPHFGSIGRVAAISADLQATAAGTNASLALIQLDQGECLAVPVQNCQKLWGDQDGLG
ncbi:MAG: hypothetical protein LLG09_04260 [Negativicutes bacterium]|nr:hypothetical protein [Negativicutes bacterium]